jgi:hypothetical protein
VEEAITAANYRQIRAVYTEETIRVYQAYSNRIADPALRAGAFVPPFRLDRMTWIKPSFLWMMYRSGWGTKAGQERVLGIAITREGFEWALENACLSHFEAGVYSSPDEWAEIKTRAPVRIQWDPESDIRLNRLDYRSIQIGLSGEASYRYAKHWVQEITDLTRFVAHIRTLYKSSPETFMEELPNEVVYPLSSDIARTIGATD